VYYNILLGFQNTNQGEHMNNIVSSELRVKASEELELSAQKDLEKTQTKSIGSLLNEEKEESKDTQAE
jgi:hypothetical protein